MERLKINMWKVKEMLCGNCGKTVVDGAMFCPYCGKKVEVERICAQCGTKLLPDAAFCHRCGAAAAPCTTADAPLQMGAEPKKAGLPELSELSPYAFQMEYYQYRRSCQRTALNRNWIVYEDYVDHEQMLLIMDADGNHRNAIMKKWDAGDTLLGVNDHGIWYACYSEERNPYGDYEVENRILVRGLSGELIHEFRFNEACEKIENIYIYGGEVYYIAHAPGNPQRIMRMTMEHDAPVCLFKGRPGEELSCLSVSGTDILLTFYLEAEEYNPKRPSGWVVLHRDLKTIHTLNGARNEYDEPRTRILDVFLEQGKMWTEPTEEEQARGMDPNARVERMIGSPEKQPALRVTAWEPYCIYFDGRDQYKANAWRLEHVRPDGTKTEVSYGGHGEADRILVNDDSVFVSYDALCPVRLPRDFHTCNEPGSENPEAILPWGQKDYRL